MSIMRVTGDAGWTLHRQRRFGLRRGRALPGPLRALPRRRGTGSWLASFVVFGAAVVVIAVGVSGLADRRNEGADQPAPRKSVAAVAPQLSPTAATIRKATEVTPVDRRPTVSEELAASAQPAAAQAKGDASPFKLDLLPVLDGDGAGFELDAAPARPVAKPNPRRAATAIQR